MTTSSVIRTKTIWLNHTVVPPKNAETIRGQVPDLLTNRGHLCHTRKFLASEDGIEYNWYCRLFRNSKMQVTLNVTEFKNNANMF